MTPRSGSDAPAIGSPQLRQTRAPGSLRRPHDGHGTGPAGSGLLGCRGPPPLRGLDAPVIGAMLPYVALRERRPRVAVPWIERAAATVDQAAASASRSIGMTVEP